MKPSLAPTNLANYTMETQHMIKKKNRCAVQDFNGVGTPTASQPASRYNSRAVNSYSCYGINASVSINYHTIKERPTLM